MITVNSEDIQAVIEAQRNWLGKLQEADPTHPIKIKILEGAKPAGGDYDLYAWKDFQDIWPKVTSPIYTRGILLNEILIDPDAENWQDVKEGIGKLHSFCNENLIPHTMGFSGGKGIHFSIIFGAITAGDEESTNALFEEVDKYNIDFFKTVRRALLFEIAKQADVDLDKIGMDKKKINFHVTRMGSQVREFGTIRAPGKYKTFITDIPEEKPEPNELPLVFPDKVEIWNIRDTEYNGIAVDAIRKEIEKASDSDEYTPISDENFKDISIKKFPCIDRLFKVGIRAGRYYAAAAVVLMCQKCGIPTKETENHLQKLFQTFPGISQADTEIRIHNALEMYGQEYHFSCTEIKETFSEYNLCNFSECPIKTEKEKALKFAKAEAVEKLRAEIKGKLTEIKPTINKDNKSENVENAMKFVFEELVRLGKLDAITILHTDLKETFKITATIARSFESELKKCIDYRENKEAYLEKQCKKDIKNEDTLPEKIDFDTLNIFLPRFEVNRKGIFSVSADKDGELVKVSISSNPCVIIAKGYNSDQGGKIFYKLLIKASPTTENIVWKNVTGLMSKSGVMGLMEYDLKFQESDFSKITGYFTAFINAYEDDLPVEMIVSSSGWKSDYTQFVVANRLVNQDGVSDLIQIDNVAVKLFGHNGTAEDWANGVDDIAKFDPVRFKIYGALGCLLIKKSGGENYIFDQCCATTRLKSFTNRLVASIIGDPKKLQLSSRSTAIGIDKIAAACNDLPVFIDETSENMAFVEELIYRFGNANTRVKSNAFNGLEISDNYNSGLFLTGEDSIITESSKGGHHARRIPETHGIPEDENGSSYFVDIDTKTKVLDAMNENFGNVIVLFIQELLPIIKNINNLVTQNFKKLPDTGRDALKERQKGYYAVMLTAGEIIERIFSRLGMTPADPFRIMCGVSEPDYI
jgi:uncharacterized protein (DUF927 family)